METEAQKLGANLKSQSQQAMDLRFKVKSLQMLTLTNLRNILALYFSQLLIREGEREIL